MRTIKNHTDLRIELERIIQYAWDKELDDYRLYQDDKKNHIFETLVALDNWISGTEFTARQWMKIRK